jgi:hypothetical protein
MRECGDHCLGIGGRRQPVLVADENEHGHVDRRQRRARVGPIADRLLCGDERGNRLLQGELVGARENGRADALGEDPRREVLPERLAAGLAEQPDGVVARQALLGRVGVARVPTRPWPDAVRASARARRRGSRPSTSRRDEGR